MQVRCPSLPRKRVSVAQAKVDCEELLVVIVQDKRAADEQERLVKADAEKIEEAKEAAPSRSVNVGSAG